MHIEINEELLKILCDINNENKSLTQWREIESDDMFSSEHFVGGFDATEDAFCFSYYDADNNEYWFQLTLAEINDIINHEKNSIFIRKADLYN